MNIWRYFNKKYILTYLIVVTGLILITVLLRPAIIEYTTNKAEESSVSVPLYGDNQLVQNIRFEQRFNTIGVRIATFKKEVQEDATLVLSLEHNGAIAGEKSFSGRDLIDNQTLWLENIEGEIGNYQLSVKTYNFGADNPIAVYVTDKDSIMLNGKNVVGGIAYHTLLIKREYQINLILLILLLLMTLLLIRCGYSKLAKTKVLTSIACGFVIISIGAFAITAYYITGHMNPEILYRLWAFNEDEHYVKNVVIDIDELQKDAAVTYIERPDGTAITAFQSVVIENIYDSVLSIKVIPHDDASKRYFDIGLYALRNNSWENAGSMRYVNSGQVSIQQYVNITCADQIRLDFSDTTSFEDLHKINRLNSITKIVLNDINDIAEIKQKSVSAYISVFILCVIVVSLIRLGYYYCLPQRYAKWGERRKITENKRFLIFGILFGTIFLLLLPIYQAPDEGAHLKEILNHLGYTKGEEQFLKVLDEFVGANRLPEQSGEKITFELYQQAAKQEPTIKMERSSTPSIHVLKHAPQALGIQIGIWFNFPAFWIFMLGRICGLIFYLIVGMLSLKIIPYKKELLLFCLISPISMQMAASLSYDAVLLSASFYLISYIFNLRNRSELIGYKQWFMIGILTALIALIKINYILLALLILTIPKSKFIFLKYKAVNKFFEKKWTLVVCLVVVAGIAGVVLYYMDYGRIVYALIFNPVQSAALLLNTLQQKGVFYLQSMFGNFGWLDTRASNGFIILILIALGLSTIKNSANEDQCLCGNQINRTKDKVIILTSWLACSLLCFVAMIQWSLRIQFIELGSTIKDICKQMPIINVIEGVQGRYFLPMLPLPLLLIKTREFASKSRIQIWLDGIYFVMLLYVAVLLLNRYWLP